MILTSIHLKKSLPQIMKAFSNVDMIVHCGDFVTLEVHEGLRRIKELKAVYGNMDSYEIKCILPETELLIINGKRIGVIHGWGSPLGIERRVRRKFSEVDAILYGHSHEASNKVINGVLFFNPGSGKRSYGILAISNDIRGEITNL